MADENRGDGDAQQQSRDAPPPTTPSFISYLISRRIDALLLFTRICTIVFCFFFLIPIVGNQSSSYQKALLSNAATSALRLHQRLPPFQLSREFMSLLFMEDSAHYLFFSLVFMGAAPVTLVLVPIFLFAVLHSSSFLNTALLGTGMGGSWLHTKISSFVQTHQHNILRVVACTEIMLFPSCILSLIGGRANLFMPFIYYRFLTLRYASRRNPYSRQLFFELRMGVEQLASHARCPQLVRNVLLKSVSLLCRLAPQVEPAQA